VSRSFCITGVSGYIGQLLARRLLTAGHRVMGIDLQRPKDVPGVDFYRQDICDPGIDRALFDAGVNTLIHLAFYTAPEGDRRRAQRVNVEGTRNVLRAAGRTRVHRVVLASSAAAYGSHPDNPVPMTEDQPLRANDYFYYSAHKAEQEKLAREFTQAHPDRALVVLRPCALIGPHINNPTGDSLKQALLVYLRNEQPPLQFIHEDDAVAAFLLAASSEIEGVFNVAPDDQMTYPELARLVHKKLLRLPFRVLCALAAVGRFLRLSPVGPKTLNFIRYPMVLDGSLFRRTTGFQAKYNSRQAVLAFVAANTPHPTPDRGLSDVRR